MGVQCGDLYAGYYVFVCPAVDSVEPVWLGRAVENLQFDPSAEHFREVLVQWYIPCRTSRDLQRLYTRWSKNANFRWKVDRSAPCADYVSTDNIMASWQPRKNDRENLVAPRKASAICVGQFTPHCRRRRRGSFDNIMNLFGQLAPPTPH